jgi:hypothetical protein
MRTPLSNVDVDAMGQVPGGTLSKFTTRFHDRLDRGEGGGLQMLQMLQIVFLNGEGRSAVDIHESVRRIHQEEIP